MRNLYLSMALTVLGTGVVGCAGSEPGDASAASNEAVAETTEALVNVLGVDDVSSGTAIDNRYPGVTFSEPLAGGHVYAAKALTGNSNVITIHNPNDPNWGAANAPVFAAEEGAVDATFATLQQSVSIDALLVAASNSAGSNYRPYFQAFNAAGQTLTTVYYPATQPAGWKTLTITRPTADIKRIRFSSQNNWQNLSGCPANCPSRSNRGHYGEFDNLRYDDGTGANSGYLGCFIDNPGRALPINLIAMNATVTSCLALARSKGYAYAGLQAGGQCFVGNRLGFDRADPQDCTTLCAANTSQYCGGDWRNSMYATGIKPVPGATGKYLGCYVDDPNRDLQVLIYESGATVESCVAAAQARGLRYAGLQWYGACFAGNTLRYGPANASECNTPCDANSNEMCGGSYRNSVYDTGVVAPPAVPANAYRGCFTDDWSRALPVQLMPNGATVESCVAAARAAGYTYAGLQAQGQCFVGNSLGFAEVSSSECSSVCEANPNQYCGGSFRNSVWSTLQ
jgi:sulfur relay (sulfurtransferase) complex TusBCD TusD component (DsrE family)